MNKNKIDKEIVKQFKEKTSFSREELFNSYKQYDPELNPRTFAWRLFDLKKKGTIQEVRKGIYKISQKQKYKPFIDERIKEIYKTIAGQYSEIKLVIWSTSWINSFSLHQTFQNFIILETEGDVLESLFYKMKEMKLPNVFLKPDASMLERYIVGEQEPIVIKNLITKAPTKKLDHIIVPTVEKILVDLFADEKIFYMYRGHEMKEIFRNAITLYEINFTKMLYYANRRGKRIEMENYLSDNFHNELEGILND
jgi:hypothetical protein